MRAVIKQIRLETEQSVESAWRAARELVALLGLGGFAQTRIATAISSLARESFRSEAGAVIEFAIEQSPVPVLIVRIDPYCRPGAEPPDECRLMDRCEIETGATCVLHMEKLLPAGFPLGDGVIEGIARELGAGQPKDALDSSAARDRWLLQLMYRIDHLEEEISQLDQELEDTNRD